MSCLVNSSESLSSSSIEEPSSDDVSSDISSDISGDECMSKCPPMTEIIEDLLVRFVLSLPTEEIESDVRFMYHMELAFWYFQDFYLDKYHDLPKLNFKTFTRLMVARLSALDAKIMERFGTVCSTYTTMESVQDLCSRYRKYMSTVPVCGCIILSSDLNYCLAVRSWNKNVWNFPKGKINKGESDEDCAIREVWEEVGLDVSKLINKDLYLEDGGSGSSERSTLMSPPKPPAKENESNQPDGIENEQAGNNLSKYIVLSSQKTAKVADINRKRGDLGSKLASIPPIRRTKLFIITGIDRFNTVFKTHTRKEIRAIQWIPIREIPFRRQRPSKYNRHIWALTRFERKLREYIKSVRLAKVRKSPVRFN